MKKILPASSTLAAVLSVLCYMATNAQAATTYYFDVNGATAGYGVANSGSYSWEDPNWANTTAGGGIATGAWGAGGFARFYGAATYTVTVNADESMAGLYQNAAGQTLTINSAGGGTLDVVAATGGQGFLTAGTTIVNAVISGAGGVNPQLSGSLYLYGNNTYSGGTYFTAGSTLTYFNNNNSFGTGALVLSQASGSAAAVLGTGGATITLPNAVQSTVSGQVINFAASANTPVVSTGAWTLGANNLQIKNNGAASSPLTISGPISGTTGVTFSGANGGTINVTGNNTTFTGTVTVGVVGSLNTTLKLGAAAFPNATGVIMNGGKLDFGGSAQTFASLATLTLSANSTMDFEGSGSVVFANSSGITWTGTLNLLNYVSGELTVGSDATGLTSAQVAELRYNGVAGDLAINSLGQIVVVPEPTTISLGIFGALGMLGYSFAKRKKA